MSKPKHDAESNLTDPQNETLTEKPAPNRNRVEPWFWGIAAAQALLLWSCHTPLKCWPVVFIAVLPYFSLAAQPNMTRRHYGVIYLFAFVYWAFTLQGIRHAHPALYLGWLALSAYLAIYHLIFAAILRKTVLLRTQRDSADLATPQTHQDCGRQLDQKSLWIIAPIAWVGVECVRNYFMTGISAAMLGHALSDVPALIQIADIGGTYAVSALIVLINVAAFHVFQFVLQRKRSTDAITFPFLPVTVMIAALVATIFYGQHRLSQLTGDPKATFALIGLDEPIEYEQDEKRELELFDAYSRQSIAAVQNSDQVIDAVIWPESMFTGTLPWLMGDAKGEMAKSQGFGKIEFEALLQERQRAFQFRAGSLQQRLVSKQTQSPPHLIAGCGIVDYGPATKRHSGIVHIGEQGKLINWYAKTHLVLYGERFPVLDWFIPIPGLTPGDGPKRFAVGDMIVSPNICIETAVERVTINHFREMNRDDQSSDVIVTVTNDGWFDDSSIVQHHKRCAQLVAVACRRPILSAANNGPTVWINSNGGVVQELPQGHEGHLIASPRVDQRKGLVMILGDWPARICAMISLILLFRPTSERRPEHSPA